MKLFASLAFVLVLLLVHDSTARPRPCILDTIKKLFGVNQLPPDPIYPYPMPPYPIPPNLMPPYSYPGSMPGPPQLANFSNEGRIDGLRRIQRNSPNTTNEGKERDLA